MIRGPVLPQQREALWSLIAGRLDAIERGLVVAIEGVDCSGGQFGLVEALARDAMGAPVLVLVAVDGDPLLPARVLSAGEFLGRVGDSLAAAVPEANLCAGAYGRVLVVGTDAGRATLDLLRRLPVVGLHVCRLETFRIGGTERFAVKWLAAEDGAATRSAEATTAALPQFVVPEDRREQWGSMQRLCERIDPAVRLDGDRFARRITWQGSLLGEVVSANGELHGLAADGVTRVLRTAKDVNGFVDLLLRRYAHLAGIHPLATIVESAATASRKAIGGRRAAAPPQRPSHGGSLRATLTAARLSPEEYSALGAAGSSGSDSEPSSVADDVARIVAAQESPWSPPRRTD